MNCTEKDTLKDHEKRITNLEISDGRILERLDNLIKSVGTLISILKAVFISCLGILASFLVWYIQNL